jgi:hypothetical protein
LSSTIFSLARRALDAVLTVALSFSQERRP